MKRSKSIIALVLSFLMLFPSLSTAAVEIDNITTSNVINIEDTIDNEITEENVESNLENTEETIIVNEEIKDLEGTIKDSEEKNDVITNEESLDNEITGENIESNLENTEDISIINEEVKDTEGIVEESKENDKSSSEKDSLVGEFYKKIENSLIDTYEIDTVYEEEQFNLKARAIKEMIVLENKTEYNYEVALAYSDGNYSYLASSDSLNEALSIIDSINTEDLDTDVLPAIINNNGQVIYSTNSMARILKHIDGVIYGDFDINTNIYSDESLTQVNGYINQGYVDDAPIIQDTGKAALIQVGGVKAWINNDSSSGNNEMIVVPLNQVTNPSYYYVSDGVLNHFITSNLKATYEYGTTITVGQAPEYLKEGIKYYSYDGHYFYTNLNQLISDLKGNHNNNSVNAGNSFYNYYKYLPFRTSTTYTTNELNRFINDNTSAGSKLRGTGEAFINAQNEYGVNALLALGLAINESNWGDSKIAQEKNNIFGLNAVDEDAYDTAFGYYSVEAGINDFAKNWISGYWADPIASSDVYQGKYGKVYNGGYLGDKVNGANVTYASDPYWGEKAAQWAFVIDKTLGGIDINLYQLSIFISDEDIYGEDGTYLYTAKSGQSLALISNNTNGVYQIHPDRTMPISTGKWMTDYDWSYKAKVTSSNIKFINTRKNETQLSKGIYYQTHVENVGWQEWKNNGEMSGTSAESKRLEGIKIMLDNTIQGASIVYQTHVQDYGWQEWKKDGQMSGTTGEAKRLEGIRINLENAPGYKVEYRVHIQDYGWQEWKSNGEIAGTTGESKRLEAIEIRIVKDTKVEYRTHVQDYGWQNFKNNGELSGTTGESKRLEAIELKLINAPEGARIVYQTHVQDYDWQEWKSNGQTSGTSGESKRLEAIKIKLENAPGYKIEYRVHIQDYGWQEWKSDGEIAGTTGEAKRLEGIEVRIVKK